MRLISVNDIKLNMVLGKSIFSQNNKLLLGAGFRITSEFKKKLLDRGYTNIYIMEDGTEDVIPEDIISDELKFQAKAQFRKQADLVEKGLKFKDLNRTKIYDMLERGFLKNSEITYDMKKVVNEILSEMATTNIMNSVMFKTKDAYYMDHALNTSVLSILIGKKYRFNKNELLTLAVGSFLHDFGKIILEKMAESKNTDSIDELMKEHPTFGYLIISKTKGSSPMICQIINQHHEQQDGNGYPIGLKGENLPPVSSINIKRKSRGTIFRFAEICSVADAYDNLVMNPKSEKQFMPAEAIMELLKKSETVYNKHIIGTLTSIIPAYPVGTIVKIINFIDPTLIGYKAVVAKVNEEHLNKPVIVVIYDRAMKKVKPRVIDTSQIHKIELELVI